MQFKDSTVSGLDEGGEEPVGWRRLLAMALVLTLAAASAGLLVAGA